MSDTKKGAFAEVYQTRKGSDGLSVGGVPIEGSVHYCAERINAAYAKSVEGLVSVLDDLRAGFKAEADSIDEEGIQDSSVYRAKIKKIDLALKDFREGK
jgi:hypothetical protein